MLQPLAPRSDSFHTSGMALKNAALPAFVGTVLVAAMLVWNFVFTLVNTIRGLVPTVTLFPAVIYAFAALSVALFFFVFHKRQS